VELLQAFLQVAGADDALVLVGDGPEKERLTAWRHRPAATVRFLPFANQTEMPCVTGWRTFSPCPRAATTRLGAGRQRAMHLGIPCLVSDLVGCQRDWCSPVRPAGCFADRPEALAATLRSALRTPPEELQRLSRNARATISGYTYQQTSDGLLQRSPACRPAEFHAHFHRQRIFLPVPP